ncbi:hypothetical protein GGR56DRAFT_686818 [Xylariaceae sp. FL0804]|nr:hypothetical protein GGR56DRAFT_686818 [Xylariaceae sp. FL0804]
MPGLAQWPKWPEYDRADPALSPADEEELRFYKKQIVDEFGEENLRTSWLKTCSQLEDITAELREKGSDIIPVLEFSDLASVKPEKVEEMKKVGCFIIRGNKSKISTWPPENPAIYRMFWMPTQQAIRGHPRHLAVQRFCNELWRTGGAPPSCSQPLSYADALRIRPAGGDFYGLGPHIDGGSLARWADAAYRAVYAPVFAGAPERLDAYDLAARARARQGLFPGEAHASVLRVFQGWTALTGTRAREGTLLVYPYVAAAIAYVLLRPFFRPPEDGDVLDASRWTFEPEDPWFPGTMKERSQYLSRVLHPHLCFDDCLVHIPEMHAGDTVWWHCDICHAVEVEHSGDHEAGVVYIPATPSTETNEEYIRRQRDNFLASKPPPDFPAGIDESVLKGYLGEKGIPNGEAGRTAMGFAL